MSAPAALGNAVADALQPLGLTVSALPVTPNSLWAALARLREKSDAAP